MMEMTRRALSSVGSLFVYTGNPIGRRDYEALLDEAVHEQIKQRFGVLCSRMAAKGSEKDAQADFEDAVRLVFQAREYAEEFLRLELGRSPTR